MMRISDIRWRIGALLVIVALAGAGSALALGDSSGPPSATSAPQTETGTADTVTAHDASPGGTPLPAAAMENAPTVPDGTNVTYSATNPPGVPTPPPVTAESPEYRSATAWLRHHSRSSKAYREVLTWVRNHNPARRAK